MYRTLSVLVSSDKLLGKEDKARMRSLLDDVDNKKEIQVDDSVWMSDKTELACKKLLDSSPDLGDDLMDDDSFMHELDKISEDFKDATTCFGFKVAEYQRAFLQYDKDLEEHLTDKIKTLRSTYNKHKRDTATDVLDDLHFRIKIAFGIHPRDQMPFPLLTPNTFAAMAETVMRFGDAVTEVWPLK